MFRYACCVEEVVMWYPSRWNLYVDVYIYINVGIPGESDILVRVVGTGWDSSSPESLARPEIGT